MPRPAREPKPKKPFSAIFGTYKTYNPEEEGFGTSEDWTSRFFQRMGRDEAITVMSGQTESPWTILGVAPTATFAEVKRAYRLKVLGCHPDLVKQHGMALEAATEMFKKVNAAFTLLEKEF